MDAFGLVRRANDTIPRTRWDLRVYALARRLSATMALTVVVLATARSSAEMAPWRLYPAIRSGVTTQEFSPTGWWFDAGLATERPIGPPWLYVSMEAALAATRWDGTHADYTMHPVWFYDSPPNPSIVGQLGFQW